LRFANLSPTIAASAVGTVADGGVFAPTAAQEPTITMVDTGASQDACQSATFDVTVNIAQGA